MTKKKILVIGRNQETMQKVLQIINQNEQWIGKGSITDENATELFMNETFDMVLLGGGIEVDSGIRLRDIFTSNKPDINIFQHFGGISTLTADIEAAFQSQGELI